MKISSSASRRIAVLGAGGRLGQALVAELKAEKHKVVALCRADLDLADHRAIRSVLGSTDFDELILTAALTAVDYCEDNEREAYSINADGPREAARVAAEKNARVTFIGTDFVFDGEKEASYGEADRVDPCSVYGASKLKGEEYVLEASPRNVVARVSWLFGPGKPAFPEWCLGKAQHEDEFSLPGDKIGCPTYAPDLARWLSGLLFGAEQETAHGVFHLCNSGPCTWQEWGQACLDWARENGVALKTTEVGAVTLDSVAAFVAKRPHNSALCTEKLTRQTGIEPRPWREALHEHLDRSQRGALGASCDPEPLPVGDRNRPEPAQR